MAKFIPNAIMLYKSESEYKMFDKDSPTFEEDSKGWVEFDKIGQTVQEAPRRGRPSKSSVGGGGE